MFSSWKRRPALIEANEGEAGVERGAPPRLPVALGLRAAGATIIVLAIVNYLVSSEERGSGQETEGNPVQLREVPLRKTSKLVANTEMEWFKFNKGTRTLSEAFKDSFPDEHSWWATAFLESNKPKKKWYWQDVIYWVEDELVKKTDEGNATFAAFQAGEVHVPIPQRSKDDQLDEGSYVGYTRRQVCYLAAKALTGAHLDGSYRNGLTRYLSKKGPGGCLPRQDAFGRALFALLATCAADPTLEGGQSGPMILVVKQHTGFQDFNDLKAKAAKRPMSEAGFRMCRYDDGSVYKQGFLPGVPKSPKELCSQPNKGPGVDYLSTQARKQAVVAGSSYVGGDMYGHSCGTGGAMEEVLMVFMPEVAVLSLFLSEAKRPQLRAPAWVLGARMVLEGLDGTGHWTNNMRINPHIHFKSDLVEWNLGGANFLISNSRPFVAVKPAFKAQLDLKKARQNRDLAQRQDDGPNSFRNQVMSWYEALTLDALPPEFATLMPKVVGSIGTGPWTSGLRFGDSQIDVLAVWLGQALASQSWKNGVYLDFYLYSYFTENPGNQCFLHSRERCGACLWTCKSKWFPTGSFYMPKEAFMSGDHSKPCVMYSEFACSQHGIESIFWNYGLRFAGELWNVVEKVLVEHKDETQSVFDQLYDEITLESAKSLDPWQV